MNEESKGIRKTAYNFLKWSEKYTKTDMVYLATGGFWLSIWQFVSSASTFIASIAFANLLPQDAYGLYKYILSIITVISIFSLGGMDTAVTQSTARGMEGSFFNSFKAKLKWGFLGSIACVITAIYYHLNGNEIISISLFVAAPIIPFLNSLTVYYSLLNGRKKFKTYTLYDSSSNVIAVLATIIALYFTNNIILLIFIYLITNTLMNWFFFRKTIKESPPNDVIDENTVSYGKHLSLAEFINTVVGQLDKILVFHYLGAVELAVYTFAMAPTEQLKGVFKNVHLLAFPKLASQDAVSLKNNIGGKLWRFGLIMTIPVLLYILLSPFFFKIFFPAYTESVIYSQILAPSVILVTLATFLYTVLNANTARRQIYEYQIYSNIVNIILLFTLVSTYGLMGAILARVVGRFILLIIAYQLVKKI